MDYTYADIAGMIDHSLLNPTLTTSSSMKAVPPPGLTRSKATVP